MTHLSSDSLTPSDRETIDNVCDRFESRWRSYSAPNIEEFLSEVDPALRDELLLELLRIDSHWRRSLSNEDRVRAELTQILPDDTKSISQVWGQSQVASTGLLSNPSVLGHYHDLEIVGEGSFGLVYRAWDSRHQRTVALKLPRLGYALKGRNLERFVREARSAGSLDHRGLARVWDSGRISGVTYIAYQYIEGANLKERFEEVSQWTLGKRVAFVSELAEAVQHAHDQGLIHRDIKPSNILITKDDHPVLTDFGLALATEEDATRSLASMVGTIEYMSPEQASGASAAVDGRADVWSLGVLLYQLTTGRVPFSKETELQTLQSILEEEPQRPRQINRRLPRDLDVVIVRCLEKRRSDRIASCKLLAEELRRVEIGEPVISRPVSFMEKSLRWSLRNPRPVTAFALILAAVAFGAWSWGGWISENRERENTVQQLQLEIESGKASRRKLLTSMMGTEATVLDLNVEDLKHLESLLVSTAPREIRYQAAVVLDANEWFTPERTNADSQRYELVVRALQDLRNEVEPSENDMLNNVLRKLGRKP